MVSFAVAVQEQASASNQDQVSNVKLLEEAFRVTSVSLNLANLPAEVTLMIMRHLGPPNSTCFGLACKRLYRLHRAVFGSVNLGWPMDYEYRIGQVNPRVDLGFVLQLGWLPRDLAYNFGIKKFIVGGNTRRLNNLLKKLAEESLLVDV